MDKDKEIQEDEKMFTIAELNMAINLSRHINHTAWELKQNEIIEFLIKQKESKQENEKDKP